MAFIGRLPLSRPSPGLQDIVPKEPHLTRIG
jgi:hypothetical protein